MTTAIAATTSVPTVTPEQLELVRKTVAVGATADELKLYLYDCARQGVHPLDKLIHFTKRSGKYTPITSIDFMRIRAAETGEYAGSDDAVFGGTDGVPSFATVTVWRLVQGTRCSFAATARMSEYKPDANDFMWKKMPHTMLAKCAEALALRKGFPKQLAGLYAKEEMDQAQPSAQPAPAVVVEAPPVSEAAEAEIPEGAVLLRAVEEKSTRNNKKYWQITDHHGEVYKDWEERRAKAAEQYAQNQVPVFLEIKQTQWGKDITRMEAAVAREPAEQPEVVELTDAEIPF